MLAPWKKSYDQPRQHIKKQRHYFANKGPSSQSYGFSSNHVWMWELDCKESWALKNWCFWTVVLEKPLESPLDSKDIKPINPKGNQSWIFIGRTDAEAETPILWPLYSKNWFIGKDPDAGKDWRQEEKRMTEDETVGWHHRLSGHELEQAPGVGDGQASLVCCSPRSHKESDTTERLNWTELMQMTDPPYQTDPVQVLPTPELLSSVLCQLMELFQQPSHIPPWGSAGTSSSWRSGVCLPQPLLDHSLPVCSPLWLCVAGAVFPQPVSPRHQ